MGSARSRVRGRPARGTAAWILLCAALAAPAASEETPESAAKRVSQVVREVAAAAPADPAAKKRAQAAFAEFASTTGQARDWLDRNESAAVVYRSKEPVVPPWGAWHDYAAAWNDLLTASRRHGAAPPKEGHLVLERKPAFWNLRVAFPVSRRWRIEYPDEDQKSAVLTQRNFAGKVVRTVTFYRYRWDTEYSGVDGVNAQKLAEVLWKLDREIYAARARDASRSLETRALNKNVPRSCYYFARGPDPEDERDKRVRNWYFKGKRNTFCVEVVEELEPSFATTDADRALVSDDDPEIALVLGSIAVDER